MKQRTITLDVRDDIRQGREPFGRIMQAIQQLRRNEDLLLIAPFEPVPLFTILAQQGFSHQARAMDSGDWEVLFSRSTIVPPPSRGLPSSSRSSRPATRTIDVDARGLEPPQPMIAILEALENLPEGVNMRAFTDRRPVHLYDQLQERGYKGESEQQKDGSYLTTIARI
jgi:uncharacterized protein (DUF2249 family)